MFIASAPTKDIINATWHIPCPHGHITREQAPAETVPPLLSKYVQFSLDISPQVDVTWVRKTINYPTLKLSLDKVPHVQQTPNPLAHDPALLPPRSLHSWGGKYFYFNFRSKHTMIPH